MLYMLKHAVTKHLDSPAPAHFDSTRPGLADHTHFHRIATNLPPGESKGSREVRKLAILTCSQNLLAVALSEKPTCHWHPVYDEQVSKVVGSWPQSLQLDILSIVFNT